MKADMGDLSEKTIMVTGATAGIGKVTALRLAEIGATVVGVGRNPAKCEAVSEEIRLLTGNPRVEFLVCDLALLARVRRLAEEFRKRHGRLDVLVNNVGGFFFRRQVTAEGIEMTFALNHLSYFLLTNLLLDLILAAPSARIVNVSSQAHYSGVLNLDDLEMKRWYNGWKAYAQSKQANVLFTYELARRLNGTEVAVNALHPGFVATQFGHNNGLIVRLGIRLTQAVSGRTPEEGARTSVYLASSPEVDGVTGKYFVDCQPRRSSPASYDPELAQRLWAASESMTGVPFKTLRPNRAASG